MSASLDPLERTPAHPPEDAEAFVAGLGLREPPRADRPRVVAAMVASADGRATVDGGAGGLGSPADRAVLRELRTAADALLVGSGTLLAERYATLLDPPQRERRTARGMPAEPLMATISRGPDPALADVPLFAEPGTRIVVYTQAPATPGSLSHGARVDVHALPAGSLSASAAIAHLAAEHDARLVVSEGGPTMLRELLAQGLVDDLVLTIAPLLVAGGERTLLNGPVLDPPLRLHAAAVARGEDHLFVHYRIDQ